MITVHITDDHKMLVEGLCDAINNSGVAKVSGVSYSINECRTALAFDKPDVLLLDLNLPDGNGIDFCTEIKEKHPHVKVLVLTTHDEYSIIQRAIRKGISGYILKNALSQEVIMGLQAIMNGEIFLCDEIDILMQKRTEQPVWLTMREQEILKLIVNGYTNQEIADEMFLSIETIKTYRKNLIFKLGAKNSMMLVKIAIENKLI